jgi:hypothetical protein
MNIVKRFNMFESKQMSTPFNEDNLKLNNSMNPIDLKNIYAMQEIPYSITIRYIIHAMTHTCVDLAYLVGQVAKCMVNLGQAHWLVIKCILKHIKGTLNYGLTYQQSSSPTTQYLHQIQRCNDIDWINDEDYQVNIRLCVYFSWWNHIMAK